MEEIITKKWCIRCKVHKLLEIDAHLYTQLGKTSSKKDKEKVKQMSKKIYTTINKMDPEIGNILLSSID